MALDQIRHVVLLILENRSFDQMLGSCPGVDGVNPAAPGRNTDTDGTVYEQTPTTVRQMLLDPRHEVGRVAAQLENNNGGFVRDFSTNYPDSTPQARHFIMQYYQWNFLPALHSLAKDFTVCDKWFSSVPGPTWTNRFFALTGTSNGRVAMPGDGATPWWKVPGLFLQQDQDTIFDRLSEKGIHWKSYFHDIPASFVLTHQRRPENAARCFYIDEFFDDARSIERDFPQFCFIEPDFYGFQENDDHPPHDIMKAERLVADVYNAIRENNDLWKSTLFVLFFDEHGGFYDHVVPPPALRPDDHHEEFGFDRFGVRVPAILVSPWVERAVNHTMFDHTSVLRYLIEKWGLGPLGRRTAQANSIGTALSRTTPRDDTDTVRRIEMTADHLTPPDPALEEEAFGARSLHHTALQKLSIYLKASLVERIPRWYTEHARRVVIPFEFMIFLSVSAYQTCRQLFRRLFGTVDRLRSSISEPDKLHTISASVRDDVARFLMRKKRQSVWVLEDLIERELPEPVRDHATRTLAAITGRPFHRYDREHARGWLRRHNH